MSELTIPERVAAGAKWLDENAPGWWQRINLDTLDIGSDCNCVLGQEYDEYTEAPWHSRWARPDFENGLLRDTYLASDRGFNADLDLDEEGESAEYAALTAEWRRLIESRRSGAVS